MGDKTEIHSTTQKFLDIFDIANDLLILKDGSTALIITVNAMNFGLLAEEEQDAIIYAYAGLLNSLNYPIQIVVKSQTKDVTSYLQLLDEELQKADSATKRDWIGRYRAFVGDLIRERNVLDKKFYVVIPASALEMGLLAPSTVLPGAKQVDLSMVDRSVILEKAKEILEPKRDHLLSQFGRIGLVARQLTTQEIIQLFYLSYNPEAAEGQQITDTKSYTTPLVKASVSKGNFMNDLPVTPAPSVQPAAAEPTPATTTPSAPMTPSVTPVTEPIVPVMPATTSMPTPMNPAPATPTPVVTPTPLTPPSSTTPPANGGLDMSSSSIPIPMSAPSVFPGPTGPNPTSNSVSGSTDPTVTPTPAPATTISSSVSPAAVSTLGFDAAQQEINSAAQQVAPGAATPAPAAPITSEPISESTSGPVTTPTPAPSSLSGNAGGSGTPAETPLPEI